MTAHKYDSIYILVSLTTNNQVDIREHNMRMRAARQGLLLNQQMQIPPGILLGFLSFPFSSSSKGIKESNTAIRHTAIHTHER